MYLKSIAITGMRELAESLDKGTITGAKPYPIKVSIGGNHPMIVTKGEASIVYDQEHIK